MAKISVTKSNTTILPDYSGSRASLCFYYDHVFDMVVLLTCGEAILLSRANVKTVIDELKKHYEEMTS